MRKRFAPYGSLGGKQFFFGGFHNLVHRGASGAPHVRSDV
jgi:hypothetical protein